MRGVTCETAGSAATVPVAPLTLTALPLGVMPLGEVSADTLEDLE